VRRLRVIDSSKIRKMLHWRLEVLSYCIEYPKNLKNIIEQAKLEVALEFMRPETTIYDNGSTLLECVNAYANPEIFNSLYEIRTKYKIGKIAISIDLEGDYINWGKNFVRLDLVEEYYMRLMEKLKEKNVISRVRTALNP
jgi:hypothetical protein